MVQEPDFDGVIRYLESETDRAAAVLGVALLDNWLDRAFRQRLHRDTPRNVFEFRGPLGDFSSRIEMAFALGWIDKDMRNDLNLLRRIRNDFAHDDDLALKFDTPGLASRLAELAISKTIDAALQELRTQVSGPKAQEELARLIRPRGRFILAVTILNDTIYYLYSGRGLDNPASATLLLSRITRGILRSLADAIRDEHR
jgi:hypothetical protein